MRPRNTLAGAWLSSTSAHTKVRRRRCVKLMTGKSIQNTEHTCKSCEISSYTPYRTWGKAYIFYQGLVTLIYWIFQHEYKACLGITALQLLTNIEFEMEIPHEISPWLEKKLKKVLFQRNPCWPLVNPDPCHMERCSHMPLSIIIRTLIFRSGHCK